ncbi:L-rhamnono-gamma-lactonase [Paraconiothyrium brasiliense]|uniref:L-rhamnono-gamma-lactonase n=1 Tax=Paraconiothyrium brasiliense TaxID=300254 RepID=A0ABR3S819_9PLEO
MPLRILDSHIHLWPSTATSSTDHGWMTPDLFLAKLHGIQEYDAATASAPVQPFGFVYVETDRYLPSTFLSINSDSSLEEQSERMRDWARAPLQELEFLRRLVEGKVQEGDGASKEDGERLKGLVIWAPFNLPSELFEIYLGLARQKLGEDAWKHVVGFRYLLQGRRAEQVRSIIGDTDFISNVRVACEKGPKRLAFDVGVDAHRDGIETLEAVSKLIEGVEEGVNFVLSKSFHLLS